MRPKSFALVAVTLLLFAGLAPVAAADGDFAVAANQPAAGDETTVTVTHNGTAAENATVDVAATDGDYSGEGNYSTDENGTVILPPPEENVTVEIAAEYEEHNGSITAELLVVGENDTAANESFGQQVSAFVHSLLNGTDEQRRIGLLIANWVVENNPGNAPEHAGPPEDAGPPSFAGPDAADGNETDGNATASGPPENPGNGNGNGDNGGGNGPPDHAGNGNGKAKGNGR